MEYDFITDKSGREINEDAVKISEKDGNLCIVVADGLGGHGRGEEASALVADEMVRCFEESPGINCIETAFVTAQKKLIEEQKQKNAKFEMKTTAVMLVIEASGMAAWGHIGDSRLYRFRKNRIKERTTDHSVPQMLVLTKDIKEKDIRFHPDRNKLLKVMGIPWGNMPYEISDAVKITKKDSFLLCTDGFWELIDEKTMEKCHKKSVGARQWLCDMETIVRKSAEGRDSDNFTATVVMVSE